VRAAYASPADIRSYRAAEKIAKDGRVRVWRDFTPTAISGEREFVGKVSLLCVCCFVSVCPQMWCSCVAQVIEVVSGDTVVVAVASGEERRLSLASIRAPRLGNARASTPSQPFAYEVAAASAGVLFLFSLNTACFCMV
jgi:staphylococcal nuclease domain-containing protein 1